MDEWRVHETRNAKGTIVPRSWDWCQEHSCEYDHFIYSPFTIVRPAEDKWDCLLDSDGKIGK